MKHIEDIWEPCFQQKTYRKILIAMSRPGKIVAIKTDTPEYLTIKAVLSSLLDHSVSISDPNSILDSDYLSLLGTRPAPADTADYIIADGSIPPDFTPSLGTLESPDHSATIIIDISSIDTKNEFRLTGPGVETVQPLSIDGLHPEWITYRQEWTECFPLGVDLIFADKSNIVAIPRTTKLEVL